MRKLALSIIVAFAVYVTAAVAQSGNMGGSSQQGTQGQSPTAQPGQTQPGQPNAPEMSPGTTGQGQDQNGPSNNTGASKSEKKLKGCVQSQNGQYVLETKKGNIALAGQDVSAHVGHEVAVKGTWQNGGNAGSSSSPTASGSSETSAWSKGTFNVTDVEMISETCKMGSKHSSSGTGSGAAGSSSPGYGNSTGNSTGGSNSGSGSTTPPQ